MSYYKTFLPPEEVIQEMKKKGINTSLHDINDTKIELRTYCMLGHDPSDISNAITHIRYLLGFMKYDIEKRCYRYAVDRYNEDDEHTVWFCGWQYSRSEPENDEESVMKYVLEGLINYTFVVKTPDWFDESEKFSEKLTEIDSLIEYYEDTMSEVYDFKIINELKEYEAKDDEDESETESTEENEKDV